MAETEIPTYVRDGYVWTHPTSDFGYYIYQIIPVRRASMLERFLWLFGVAPRRGSP